MIHQKIFYYTTLALAFMFPLEKKLIPPLIIILFLNWLIEGDFRKKLSNMRKKSVAWLFVSFYFIHIIGLIYSANVDFGLFDLQIKLSLLIFPLVISTTAFQEYYKINDVFNALISGCLVAIAVCLINAFCIYSYKQGDAHSFFYMKLSVFHHPSYFSMYLCLGIAYMLYMLTGEKRELAGGWLFFYKMALPVFCLFNIILSAKAGVIVMALTLSSAFIYYVFVRKKFVHGSVILVVSVVLLIIVLRLIPSAFERMHGAWLAVERSTKVLDKKAIESTTVRMLIWPVAKEIISENFILGVGTGDIKDELLKKYRSAGMTGVMEKELNVHNQYLQTFAALGFTGFLLLTACLLAPMILSLKRGNYLYLFFLMIVIINFAAESTLEVQAGVVFYSFFNALFAFCPVRNLQTQLTN